MAKTTREVDWESSLTAEKCEYAYGLASEMQMQNRQHFAEIGLRAAQARDPKLIKALEKMAEHTTKADDDQRGETRRTSKDFSEQRYTTTTQMCREAYKMVDQGTPVPHLQWIYGAAAWLCGYVIR